MKKLIILFLLFSQFTFSQDKDLVESTSVEKIMQTGNINMPWKACYFTFAYIDMPSSRYCTNRLNIQEIFLPKNMDTKEVIAKYSLKAFNVIHCNGCGMNEFQNLKLLKSCENIALITTDSGTEYIMDIFYDPYEKEWVMKILPRINTKIWAEGTRVLKITRN